MFSLSDTVSINNWIPCFELLLHWLSLAKQIANESNYSSDSLYDNLKWIDYFIWFTGTISNEAIRSSDSLGQSQINWFIQLIHLDNLKWTDSFTWFTVAISNELIHSRDSSWQFQINGLIHLILWDKLKCIDPFNWIIETIANQLIHSPASLGNLTPIDSLIWLIVTIIILTLKQITLFTSLVFDSLVLCSVWRKQTPLNEAQTQRYEKFGPTLFKVHKNNVHS